MTKVNYVPPKEVSIQKEPLLRQHLILAYQIQELLTDGKARDPKQVARWLNLSDVRIYQLMGMLFLSPRIQEEIFLSKDPILLTTPEYKINELIKEVDWNKQELAWEQVVSQHAG